MVPPVSRRRWSGHNSKPIGSHVGGFGEQIPFPHQTLGGLCEMDGFSSQEETLPTLSGIQGVRDSISTVEGKAIDSV